ncbi:GNAT family N-acetyltransferase [Luteimonas sp. RIT-PG2_3]
MIFHRDTMIGPDVIALLEQHRAAMEDTTPAESRHALDATGLRQPEVSFWTLHLDDALVGCGALKHLDPGHAEIKAMRTAKTHLNRGLGKAMLDHLMAEAARGGYRRLSLETGAMAYFEPARRLYLAAGFTTCPPFGDYVDDPNTVFLTRLLDANA